MLLVSDFQSEYQLDLEAALDSMLWRRFDQLITGLMTANTRTARFFSDD